MRPHVCLLLALAALHARAASIPAPVPTDFEKKLTEAVKEVLEKDAELQNVPSEQELTDQTNGVKDIDNKLLKQVGGDAIPVKVVVEEVKPSLKASEEKKNGDLADISDIDEDASIKRVEIDLKHPGEPQRQEHETQNPEHFENDNVALTSIKKMISDAQNVFNKGFADVTHGINDLLVDHDPVVSVKESIENLRSTFTEHIDKLNTTLQSFWNPNAIEDTNKQQSVKNVESGLKVLEDNFESGVDSLSDGVQILAVLKSEIRQDPASTTAKPASNPLFPFFENFQNTITHGFGNLTTTVQNFFTNQGNNSSAAVAGAQADEGAKPPPSKPSLWSTFQGFLNPGQQQQGTQNDDTSSPIGPFAQVIQNNPFVQGVINFIQPKPQQSQTQSDPPAPPKPVQSTDSQGSNVVPAAADTSADQQQKEKPQEAQPAPAQGGPIQQIIQRNPIVQGITGAVQKIQHTITNPEKPREEPVEDEKAGFFPYGGYHHGGHRPSDEHNNDVDGSGVVKSDANAAVDTEKIEKVSAEETPAKEEPLKEAPPKEEPLKDEPLKIAPEVEEPSPEVPIKQD